MGFFLVPSHGKLVAPRDIRWRMIGVTDPIAASLRRRRARCEGNEGRADEYVRGKKAD